jgi:hypothetical protein
MSLVYGADTPEWTLYARLVQVHKIPSIIKYTTILAGLRLRYWGRGFCGVMDLLIFVLNFGHLERRGLFQGLQINEHEQTNNKTLVLSSNTQFSDILRMGLAWWANRSHTLYE